MIETLGFEKDNSSNLIEIKSSDSVLISPIYSFYLIHFAELINKGFALPPSKLDFTNSRVVYAERDNNIAGIIMYDCQFINDRKYATIILSAVDTAFRKQGIYKILHYYLEDVIKKLGCDYLTSYVWKTNSVRQQTLSSVGLNPDYLLYGKRI